MVEIERKIEEILREKGQGIGLTVKRLRLILHSLGYEMTPMQITSKLWKLKQEGKVVKDRRRLWRLVIYGG
jgi:hypothetical protein